VNQDGSKLNTFAGAMTFSAVYPNSLLEQAYQLLISPHSAHTSCPSISNHSSQLVSKARFLLIYELPSLRDYINLYYESNTDENEKS
jgi:hypothetical protein